MEALPEPRSKPAPPERQLPSGKNKVERISAQTKGLFDDFTSWVELRLKLFQAEVQEKVESKVNEAIIKVAPFVAAAIGGFFALITLALFLGWWLGHPAWGFLCVTLLFAAITGILLMRKKRLAREKEDEKKEETGDHPRPATNGEVRRIS